MDEACDMPALQNRNRLGLKPVDDPHLFCIYPMAQDLMHLRSRFSRIRSELTQLPQDLNRRRRYLRLLKQHRYRAPKLQRPVFLKLADGAEINVQSPLLRQPSCQFWVYIAQGPGAPNDGSAGEEMAGDDTWEVQFGCGAEDDLETGWWVADEVDWCYQGCVGLGF